MTLIVNRIPSLKVKVFISYPIFNRNVVKLLIKICFNYWLALNQMILLYKSTYRGLWLNCWVSPISLGDFIVLLNDIVILRSFWTFCSYCTVSITWSDRWRCKLAFKQDWALRLKFLCGIVWLIIEGRC